jgi:FtsH-binding integral membrane protein
VNSYPFDTPRSPEAIIEAERSFIVRVYGWMTLGLVVTALAAFYTLSQENLLRAVLTNTWLFIGLMFVELALVIILTAWIGKLTVMTARVGFIGYSALTGVTLSIVLLIYTASSVAQVFFITAGIFGVMSAYGYLTKRDLTSIGNLLLMGLIGLIIASVVNLFLASGVVDWALSIIGVIIFVGLTAYDTQRLKRMAAQLESEGEVVEKASIIGALALYLDFINLFLRLLRLFGKRR